MVSGLETKQACLLWASRDESPVLRLRPHMNPVPVPSTEFGGPGRVARRSLRAFRFTRREPAVL
jgi:hypothetical protein